MIKVAYVGYTATPFANIFIPIDEDNFFPRDFIINIPPHQIILAQIKYSVLIIEDMMTSERCSSDSQSH